jgi:hypothetical protein
MQETTQGGEPLSAADLVNADHLDPDLRDCLLGDLIKHDRMQVYENKFGALMVRTPGGIRVPAWRLCAVRSMWVAHVEYAPLDERDKITIMNLLLNDPTASSYVEPVPGGVRLVTPQLVRPTTPTKH